MKAIQFFAAFLLTANALQAQDYGLYWKYKDYDGAIAVSVPRWATFVGSAFVDEKEDRRLVRKIRKVRVLFFEDGSPFSQRDMKRFARKAKRRHLDELMTVRKGKTYISVLAKERGNAIRKVVVLVNSPEGSALVTIKGKFRLDDLNRVIQKSSKKKDGNPTIPNLPKVPVIRA
ncbi:MAG: DUF4252 domain-containing protein [Saprospiraceae bacterium]